MTPQPAVGGITPDSASELRAIVFDLDGTLYESAPFGHQLLHESAVRVAELRGISTDEGAALLRETRERLTAEQGREPTLATIWRELGADLREMHRHLEQTLTPEEFLSPEPRVIGLLEKLSARFAVEIYTNNNRHLSRRILETIGCDRFFPRLFTVEDSWTPKPHREALETVLRKIGRQPGEVLFVGDRYEVDLRLPAELGCRIYLSRTIEELLGLKSLAIEE